VSRRASRGSESRSGGHDQATHQTHPMDSLRAELRRLQSYGLGTALRNVVWHADPDAGREAEVLDDVIFVYVLDLPAARRALIHEVLHHALVESRKPYLDVINALLARANTETYAREERLVERLLDLLDR